MLIRGLGRGNDFVDFPPVATAGFRGAGMDLGER